MEKFDLDDSTERLVRKLGKPYIPSLLPADIEVGPLGLCFDWSALQAAKNRQYKYVEGIATNPEVPGEWILHAWLTDGVHAFDPTWQASTPAGVNAVIPSEYIGIEMNIFAVAAFMRATGYQGVLGNQFRNPELANVAIYGESLMIKSDKGGLNGKTN